MVGNFDTWFKRLKNVDCSKISPFDKLYAAAGSDFQYFAFLIYKNKENVFFKIKIIKGKLFEIKKDWV